MAAAALEHDAADFDEQDVLYDESDRVDSEGSDAEAGPAGPEPASESEEELLDMDQDEGGLTIEGTHSESQKSSTLRVSLIASPDEVGKHAASPRMDVPLAKYPRQLAGCASMPARTSYVRMGTSAPINIPNMARWRPDKASDEPGQASTFVPPHQLSKQEQDFTFSFSGASPSAAVKRERLRTRNAILRSTGFLEPGATAAAAAAAAAAVARAPVQSSLTAALTTIGEV